MTTDRKESSDATEVANLIERPITRRSLIERGAGIGALALTPSLLLAACGSDTSDEEGTEAAAVGGSLQLLTWQGYDLPDGIKPWTRENSVKVAPTYIATHDDIQAKIKQGQAGTYDLTTYYQGYGDLYRELDIISPLDPDRVPAYENNYAALRGQPDGQQFWESDGELWGVPFTFGSYTLNYNADEIRRPPRLWSDLLDPQYKDKVALYNDPQGAILIGSIVLDLPVPKLTPEQLDQVIDFWREFRTNARTIAPSPGDVANLFASGEIVAVAPGYSGITAFGRDQGVNMGYSLPEEGGASFSDAWAIPPEAPNPDTAYAWINETLTPELQVYQAESLAAGVAQPDAVAGLNKETRELFPYDDLEGWFEQAPLYNLPPSNEEGITNFADWLDAWNAFIAESE